MKSLNVIFYLLIILACASCGKENLTSFNQRIKGTWNVISDSTFVAGIDAPNHESISNKYIGQTGDYFIFTDSHVYIKESNVKTDTATYRISKDTLVMTYAHLKEGIEIVANAEMKYLISSTGSANLELSSTGLISPGGEFSEVIKLTH